MFNGFPGADTVERGQNQNGQYLILQPISITAPYDLSHRHSAWRYDYDIGRMNGFSDEYINCYAQRRTACPPRDVASYGYVPRGETQPYWTMAERYTFADEMFQTNQGPSFPAHQYLVSGTSTISYDSPYKASENATAVHESKQGGCDSVKSASVETIDAHGNRGPYVFPCFDRDSIMHLMNQNDVSWHYYQERRGAGQWHGPDAIRNIRYSSSYANVLWPSSRVLTDIRRGDLASVTFVTPSAAASDHAGRTDGSGPSWVASIVNEIGESSFWNTTAIVVVWDDWGGWYDHVKPSVYNSYELGFRVPMIVISPYAKARHVSHVHYEFGSILKFIEKTFNLPSLNTTDRRASNLADCFDFNGRPRKFTPIPGKYSAAFFERRPVDNRSVDDDQ
jgi:phospholipase C